jgi:phenylacetic acid degradation operon negative regulatory protein
VRARSALFELYGDHLRTRGAAAPVAGIVRLLGPLDIAAPAARTAISRMVREGWLTPAQLPDGRGYALTPFATTFLEDVVDRIYRTRDLPSWDGRWHIVHTAPTGHRSTRERLRSGMGFLGYAALDEATWISPRRHRDVQGLLEAAGVASHSFLAEHDGDSASLVAETWDLQALAAAYQGWQSSAAELVSTAGADADDRTAYTVRCRLLHEWRLFLFRDPGLPRVLLPASWPGDDAAAFFDRESARLLPAGRRYVDECLPQRPHVAPAQPFPPKPRRESGSSQGVPVT